jgi:AbrB family looped-hinge helix DNA binding protein
MAAVAKVTTKGQITIPKEIRRALGLRTGDEVEFVAADGGFSFRHKRAPSPFDAYVGYSKERMRELGSGISTSIWTPSEVDDNRPRLQHPDRRTDG